MTRQSNDGKQTPFSLWLRNKHPDNVRFIRDNDPIDSAKGFTTTDIDYVWMNYKTGEWFIIEEKRYCAEPEYSQREVLNFINRLARKADPEHYKGLYYIVFENTNPEDGKIWVNKVEVDKNRLLRLLRFEWIKTARCVLPGVRKEDVKR
jgi:hypothetical protein